MSTTPKFNSDGLLPAGDYPLTLDELRKSALVLGSGDATTWDTDWRGSLVDNLAIVVGQLWAAGLSEIYADGSFVENVDHPNDIDVYFACDMKEFVSGRLEDKLNHVDPKKSWTWEDDQRRFDDKTGKSQLPMWFNYHIEAWPDYGQGSTVIHPSTGKELTHPELFRITRFGAKPKGIIKIIRN